MAGDSGGDVVQLDALGPKGPWRTRNRLAVADVAGRPAAELSLVPPLFVDRAAAALHKAGSLPRDQRIAAITQAAELYSTGTVEGRTVEEHARLVSRVGGVPLSVVRASIRSTAERLVQAACAADNARPRGAANDWRDPLTRTGHAVWARRANVFAVHAAGNHPGTHSLWPEALVLGYRVAVRPSRREPFTPHRLITALRACGFDDDQVVLLPTDHAAADSVLRGADLGLVYGGADVVKRYGGDPRLLLQGPGRSKVLITADVDWREHLDTIVDSVAGQGGTGCVNATAVFVEGDPTELCRALAERLGALPSLPPDDERAVLPAQPRAVAHALADHLHKVAEGTRSWLGDRTEAVTELEDGSAVLRPAVHQADSPHAPQLGVELPFPCVWVAPWAPDNGAAPLRDTLVLTAISHRAELFDLLLEDPTIANLYIGDHPTHTIQPGLPHDGYLAEFLMRSKAVIRDVHEPADAGDTRFA